MAGSNKGVLTVILLEWDPLHEDRSEGRLAVTQDRAFDVL